MRRKPRTVAKRYVGAAKTGHVSRAVLTINRRVLYNKVGIGIADADVLAVRTSPLGSGFNDILFIQAKHHQGISGDWGVKQLKAFQKMIEDDKRSFSFKYGDGKTLDDADKVDIRYVLVTSADLPDEISAPGITFINGDRLCDMLFNVLDKIDDETRHKLGIKKSYGFLSGK